MDQIKNIKKNTGLYTFHLQSDPSLSFHIIVGTGTQQVPQQNNTQEQYSNLPLEPAAYNSGGGGFATF
jgi:hypothetical protein